MNQEYNKTPPVLAGFGAFLILVFLFLPLSYPAGNIYIVWGGGEQWLLLLSTAIAAFALYRNSWQWSAGSVGTLLLTAFFIVYRVRGLNPASDSPYYRRTHLGPEIIHWLALAIACGLFAGGAILLLIDGWHDWKAQFLARQGSQGNNPRLFDPRRYNAQATVGFCCCCGTKNPLNQAKCRQCKAPLAWIALPSTSPRPTPRSRPQASGASFWASVDWGWWGIAALSLIAWPMGLLLYFAYSRTGDDKGGAALIGAGIGLVLMALRFVFMMSRVGT